MKNEEAKENQEMQRLIWKTGNQEGEARKRAEIKVMAEASRRMVRWFAQGCQAPNPNAPKRFSIR